MDQAVGAPPISASLEGSAALPRYVILDTETTSLPLKEKKGDPPIHADAPGQPRLCEISLIFVNERLEVEREFHAYIKPEGWDHIAPEAAAVHGLTIERLQKDGIPVADALGVYTYAIDSGYIVVAHGARFDTKIMRGELRRAGMDDRREATQNICTMQKTVGICRIKQANGKGLKYPKVSEAFAHFYKHVPEGMHTTGGDTRAVLAIFRALVRIGIVLEPKIISNKNYVETKPAAPIKPPEPPEVEPDLFAVATQAEA